MPNVLSDFVDGLRQLLSEPCCASCDVPLRAAESGGFCAGCFPLLEPAGRASRPPAATAALFLYGGPLATALQRLKYGGRTDLAGPLGRLLLRAAPSYGGRVDCVIPMPLHGQRLRARGYNQVALLARPLAKSLAVPLEVGSLRRVRPTAKQADLDHGERVDNVRGAFRATRRGRPMRILLVDDVRTSGATLAEAAAALKAAGHVEVRTLALAFAQR